MIRPCIERRAMTCGPLRGDNMFKLSITMGNDAMQTPEDVAAALREVASKMEDGHDEGSIRDVNGNKVGTFRLNGSR